ncbi:MAG: LysM peptidoglycan-binding domain-containing protein [Pseudonocardia sp.]|uniref:LysM peptidoglycan-binding domain-containing protein n=1 Tax=Pseudonocardia sp. TaxID=60912 RepID=UPI001AC69177|nr:transglycosylase family protein [Pseudonocardia sp.]MBN9103012.1 LysM peptidoglycan-binding domain-containing protein [Pseudonocardia sp.]
MARCPRTRYRGRHRAPSNTGRVIARTAFAGAVAGAPLVTMVPAANAATDTTWDKLAQCESGGRWDINTGNGFQGGLQFTPSTWRAFGGTVYAPAAHQATRAQQIAVAEKVLAKQGWNAWPSCSKKVGASGGSTDRGVPSDTVRLSAPTKAPAKATTGSYKVKSGDTLGSIAAANRVAGGWKAIVAKNPALAGNPNVITPGQMLTL